MNEFINLGLLDIIKVFLWILLLLFILFSLIVVRQVQLMNRVLTVPIAGGFKFAALGLMMFTVIIFIISLIVL